MKFHLITHQTNAIGSETKTAQFLENACRERGVECVRYNVMEYGSAFTYLTLPKLGKGDLLYRNSRGQVARNTERLLNGEAVTTFYSDWRYANFARSASWFTHIKYGLPVVPSYPGIPQTYDELDACVASLGSFPIIIKVTGGSLGVGVMRIDSMQSLRSVLDYLTLKKVSVMLRKYIPHKFYVRAVVVGDKVVASKAAYVHEGEFRTNTLQSATRKREEKILPVALQDKVVQAVRTLGVETGGVDLLFDKEGEAYIAEVNFPNDFSTAQKVTGIDVAGAMLDHLIKKAEGKLLTEGK